jgi:hypothetical protein
MFLPGEREALRNSPRVSTLSSTAAAVVVGNEQKTLKAGESIGGWELITIIPSLNGTPTAVFEKHVTHQGAIVYVCERGEIASIPKRIGDLSKIRPRPTNASQDVAFRRPACYTPGPDRLGGYILNSVEDPCYENVAALGPEYVGWTLVANEEAGPERSLWLEPDGKSRELGSAPESLWAPDLTGRLFDPHRFLPSEYMYDYVPGYSKRTLLGGYLPAADIGVWNPQFGVGYEVMAILPHGADARPLARVRVMLPRDCKNGLAAEGDFTETSQVEGERYRDHFWNGSPNAFFSELLGIWSHWHHFFDDKMKVEIPDEWLLDAARAGIVLSRCSYRGLQPSYQIGEGAYTKVPERFHGDVPMFPVAHYEFVWAHQLWNLADEVEPYFQYYLDHYILPDGNFSYNRIKQVEAPLNTGVFLENSARAYDYAQDIDALERRLPILRRMIQYVLERRQYTQRTFAPTDPRHGLIWGSPEADLGDPADDNPQSHPYYYQNSTWIWRGLHDHARCLLLAGEAHHRADLKSEGRAVAAIADEMRADIDHSLAMTLEARNPAMKAAGITPFGPFDTKRQPRQLSSYENHRFMMDWWTSDWGDPDLDMGHFRHREIAGEQILGMNTDGDYPRTSNFMEHGTLAGRIRQEDYRPYLLTLYGVLCYAMDSGNRYAPEDALLPGSYPGEGRSTAWSAVVNSELQPTVGLRWLLCYEEHDRNVVHLQKAAPKHWFAPGEKIRVKNCPTRFGPVSWTTEALSGHDIGPRWRVEIWFSGPFDADLIVYIHSPMKELLRSTSMGELGVDRIVLRANSLVGKKHFVLEVT